MISSPVHGDWSWVHSIEIGLEISRIPKSLPIDEAMGPQGQHLSKEPPSSSPNCGVNGSQAENSLKSRSVHSQPSPAVYQSIPRYASLPVVCDRFQQTLTLPLGEDRAFFNGEAIDRKVLWSQGDSPFDTKVPISF